MGTSCWTDEETVAPLVKQLAALNPLERIPTDAPDVHKAICTLMEHYGSDVIYDALLIHSEAWRGAEGVSDEWSDRVKVAIEDFRQSCEG